MLYCSHWHSCHLLVPTGGTLLYRLLSLWAHCTGRKQCCIGGQPDHTNQQATSSLYALPEMQIPQFMLAAIWKSELCPPTLHTHCLFHTIDLEYIYLIIYLLILYAVSLIEKSAIISKLSYWASNCTLIHPIRSAHVSNLMNHVVAPLVLI